MSGTVFTQVNYDLRSLIEFIERGEIGLPDIQRPFVWKNVKVRDLFDSMYRGYPVGYLLFWQNGFDGDARVIGANNKQKVPRLLIVDGQQRLTSLYAVIKNVPVVRENYASEPIKIAFDPLQEKFEVTDAAIRRDKAYIADISCLWQKGADLFEIVDEYLEGLKSTREVTAADTKQVRRAMSKLSNLLSFSFIALELAASVNEEQVADVFVRINSKGTPLNQADFILTLMSVFWDEGRAQLEAFCRDARQPSSNGASSYNHFFKPDPDQLLRVSVGLSFRRARLHHVYSILRGKDLETEEFSEERREKQFEVLKSAQTKVLDLQHWHDFLAVLRQAGFRSNKMITSQNSVLYCYVLYLIGRTDYGVDEFALRRVMGRWFFMASLTGRYTGSPESAMEFDLARFRDVNDAETFVRTLQQVCDQTLTEDYWTIQLPNELATASSRSPSLFAYYASLVLLDAKVLYSGQKVADLLDPTLSPPRSAMERHHLFPRGYLESIGVGQRRERNQIANYAFVEWGDNVQIADQPPSEYVPVCEERFAAKDLEEMYYWHALPDGWASMTYQGFLERRRELMAKVIRDGYMTLKKNGAEDESHPDLLPVDVLVKHGESDQVEFKSTLRMNLHTKQKDPRIELACLKTIAAFLNSDGGTLIIGVSDDGTPLGLEADAFPNEDKMSLHLVNLLTARIGPEFMMYIHPHFADYDHKRVLVVECSPARSAAFVREGNDERFFVRAGPSTQDLSSSQMVEYINQRFA